MDIVVGASLELMQVLRRIFEIFPRPLGSHIESAHWIASPPVALAVVVVVRIGIDIVLVTIVSQVGPIEVVLGLKGLRQRAGVSESLQRVNREKRNADGPEPEERQLLVLSSDDVSHKHPAEVCQGSSLIGGLVELLAVVSWQAVVADDAFQEVIHL